MTRTIDFRYNVLRSGAYLTELKALPDSAPTLRMDDGGAIKMSFSGVFRPNGAVNWLTDELQPVMILDGVEHELGVYIPTTAEESEAEGEESVSVEAYDRAWRVQDQKSETLLYFAAGTNYLAAVEQLLSVCGVALIQKTESDAVLAEDRQDWPVGTSYLTIVNDLLGEINYRQLWFNAAGVAILEPIQTAGSGNIRHTLSSEDIRSLLLPSFQRSLDVFSAPNVFVCICNNPDKSGQMIATAENTDPQSPLSIPRRGRRIVQLIKLNNIADQTALQAYADRLKEASLGIHETISVQTALFPGWGVDDVTALSYGDFSAICTERAWSMELTVGGTMQHTMERVIYSYE